ncbi:MAG: GTP 3',8-cyclase MoaA [Lachnospiraceae bacterium]|nr:GTP 3',8-cyclase MoaA [Lachnospiraceae bacterium]
MKDSKGRTIDYMRISITDRCNLRCQYCMPEDVPSMSHEEVLRFEEILRLCRLAGQLGIRKFKVTGGEPLVRKGALSFLKDLKALPFTEQVTLTTNGILLKDIVPELKSIGIDGINVSLDTLRKDTFQQITRRDYLPQVLDGIFASQEAGIKTKINSVLMHGINDGEFFDLIHLARDYQVDVRFIEIMPIGYGSKYQGYNREKLLALLSEHYPYYTQELSTRGNGPASYIHIPGFKGCIGFIDAIHGKFCSSCNRVRLTSDGILKLCLYYQNGVSLRELLRSGASDEELLSVMQKAVERKPTEHQFHQSAQEGQPELRQMSQIGG